MFGITGLSARIAVLGIVSAILFGIGYYACYRISYLPERDAYTKFVAQTEQIGKDQAEQVKLKEAADKLTKEKYDEQQKAMADELGVLSSQLYHSRSSRGYLPKASTGSRHPKTACFNRLQLEQAIQQLDAEVQGLITQGDSAILGLNISREWAQGR